MQHRKNKFQIGFWNYNRAGEKPAEAYVAEWEELGMNLAMSSVFDPKRSQPQDLLLELDEAAKRNISVIIYDYRIHWTTLMRSDEETFRKGVLDVKRDFAGHPAAYGFHIGDEPKKEDNPYVVRAAGIIKELIPDKKLFVNFYPDSGEADFARVVGVTGREYPLQVARMASEGKLSCVCYDCYTQCSFINPERGLDMYFRNLNAFYKAAVSAGLPLWTSLLSVGHWHYRVPTEDDLRWQIATAVAHGCKGIMWFYVYGGDGKNSSRGAPVDENGYRTPTFGSLARQNRAFMKYHSDNFANSELLKVEHSGHAYGDTPPFASDELVQSVSSLSGIPLIISRFKKFDGGFAVVVVNLSQVLPTFVKLIPGCGYTTEEPSESWLAPGQLVWFDLSERNDTDGSGSLK